MRPAVEEIRLSSVKTNESLVQSRRILGARVDATSYVDAVNRVTAWARLGESRYVCAASMNNIMEAHDSPEFKAIHNAADLVTPDGTPLVWGLRLLGLKHASRVYGPDLTPALLAAAERDDIPVGFYGASQEVLDRLLEVVKARWPKLDVRYALSPPFRPLTDEEDATVVRDINSSGTRILFVGLNTPKQDRWMAAHRGRVDAVMIGVGAAFDFLAGTKPQAPRWLMPLGLEWLFRLITEPGRLWKRYTKHVPRFAVLLTLQVLIGRRNT
jgi:N-acetylglucosaminyldiphosphoundecaprenol N-acetyl-beta-D-mannosaminyltransferase